MKVCKITLYQKIYLKQLGQPTVFKIVGSAWQYIKGGQQHFFKQSSSTNIKYH